MDDVIQDIDEGLDLADRRNTPEALIAKALLLQAKTSALLVQRMDRLLDKVEVVMDKALEDM